MKKSILIISVLVLGLIASAQVRLETTIKIVAGGKIRIAVKATNGAITLQTPSNFIFVVAIPAANDEATIASPSSPVNGPVASAGPGILDASRLPTSLLTESFTDATYKYFLFYFTGLNAVVTYASNQEYELIELNWGGTPNQNCPVSLISIPNGTLTGATSDGSYYNYLEAGTQVSNGLNLFYQSGTSLTPTQMNDVDLGGSITGLITTSSSIWTLPVSLFTFSGYNNGTKNTLKWSTSTEQNNRGFEIQRSDDGANYTSVGFVNTQAPGGNSFSNLNYSFDDNNPTVGKKLYYRLRQEDFDGRSKLSNIVMISGGKANALSIGGLFPNPASTQVSIIIDAPKRDNLTLMIMDISGKTIKQQSVNVDIGSNTVPVDITSLAKGSYIVKVVCQSSDCEAATGKFNKQ